MKRYIFIILGFVLAGCGSTPDGEIDSDKAELVGAVGAKAVSTPMSRSGALLTRILQAHCAQSIEVRMLERMVVNRRLGGVGLIGVVCRGDKVDPLVIQYLQGPNLNMMYPNGVPWFEGTQPMPAQ